MKKLIALTSGVLTLSLCMLWGDAVENWALGYLAALAFVQTIALAVEFRKEV